MAYTPDQGEIIWLSFTPQTGSEQAGRRPGVILSPASYNGKVGLALICPITNQVKGYPFEVTLPAGLPVTGVILADQVKSLDWRSRNAAFLCQAPPAVITEVIQKVLVLLPLPPP